MKVRKLEQIIADEIDTSDYGTKKEVLDAARKILDQEKSWRRQELDDEAEMKRQEREAKDLFRKRGRDPRTGMSPSEQKRLRRSGTFKICGGLFGCGGTGWKHNLPHARCRGTGMIKISKSVRRRKFKLMQKRKRKSFWGSKKKRRR